MIDIAGVGAGAAGTPALPNAATNGAANGAARERALAPAPGEVAWPELGVNQRTCLAVLRGEWTTLALVPTDPSAPVKALSDALSDVSRGYRLRPLRLQDGAGASPARVAELQDELAAARGGDARLVVTLDDPRTSPAAVPLLVAAEAVVLVVRLGATGLRAVDELVEIVGRERILGCVVAR